MKPFEKLLYLFTGVAIGFLLFAFTHKKPSNAKEKIDRFVDVQDWTKCGSSAKLKYLNRLYNESR